MLWYLHGPRFDMRSQCAAGRVSGLRERSKWKDGLTFIYEIESVKPHAADHEYRVFWETMAQIEARRPAWLRLGVDRRDIS